MESTCESLTIEEIVFINRRMYETYGGHYVGSDNLEYRGSLEYILNAIHESYFGQELFSDIIAKCVAVGTRIITGHIFHDGNKRTGLEVCRQFLEINGYVLSDAVLDEEAEGKTLLLADDKLSEVEFLAWVRSRVAPIKL